MRPQGNPPTAGFKPEILLLTTVIIGLEIDHCPHFGPGRQSRNGKWV